MKKMLMKIIIILTGVSLVGCTQMTNQDVGTLTGAVAGGLLGSRFGGGAGQMVAIGVGTLAGAYIGGAIGRNMDETDRLRMNEAFERNGEGEPAYWRNRKTGARYTVIPTRDVSYHGNRYCREYRSTAIIGGKREQVYGTACRQPDGAWKIVK